ncbi:uncharacterized protein [Parasteatoda tepidariorum]|nr:uncharacterized protein LOC107449755 isoform X2 [Parasteatoda tepidariorum]
MVKKLKKSSKTTKKPSEQEKSESYRVPIIISAPPHISPHDIPVSIELHDDDRYIKSSPDLHPIEPIHLRPLHHHPRSSKMEVYHGPVAVPADYPYGSAEPHHYYEPKNELPVEDHGDLSAIPGAPGLDYPTYSHLPETGFKCLQHTSTPGFYADVETKCQMWHYCQPDGRHDRFLCPNGTVFDQLTRVCNWWFNVYCDNSLSYYDINFDLYRESPRITQPSETPVYYHEARPSHPENSVMISPNSFLRHVEEFEAKIRPGDSYKEYSPYDSHNAPLLSAATRQEKRYPLKLAPSPQVRHDPDVSPDSSNARTVSTPVEKPSRKRGQKKRVPKRKKQFHSTHVPTYREAKATPAARRYRLVRRRKVNKN